MFDNPTDNHTDIEVPLYYKLRFTKLKTSVKFSKKKPQEIPIENFVCKITAISFQGSLC